MLEMTKPVVEALAHEDPGVFMDVASRQMNGRTLGAHAASLAAQGRTTVLEAMRVGAQVEQD
jgi:MSHA biogenesis protein MshE